MPNCQQYLKACGQEYQPIIQKIAEDRREEDSLDSSLKDLQIQIWLENAAEIAKNMKLDAKPEIAAHPQKSA